MWQICGHRELDNVDSYCALKDQEIRQHDHAAEEDSEDSDTDVINERKYYPLGYAKEE